MTEEEEDVAPMPAERQGGTDKDDATGGGEISGPNEPLVVTDDGLAKSLSCKSISSRFFVLLTPLAVVARRGTGS